MDISDSQQHFNDMTDYIDNTFVNYQKLYQDLTG